ncbi:hypothetical protein HYC85_001753 [Camellia sinensis]|uniref:Uncharacterized protein n=1 Tax=Camellia sinensis TaxID=4442 RepID=A0A7J7I838_CAMSI|nr:hypothetical protein HYC85_001753 [Camellia sinensis]
MSTIDAQLSDTDNLTSVKRLSWRSVKSSFYGDMQQLLAMFCGPINSNLRVTYFQKLAKRPTRKYPKSMWMHLCT